MKGNESELLCDVGGIELVACYDWEITRGGIEECHGYHNMNSGMEIELTEVYLSVRGGQPIDVLPLLNSNQRETIIDSLCVKT